MMPNFRTLQIRALVFSLILTGCATRSPECPPAPAPVYQIISPPASQSDVDDELKKEPLPEPELEKKPFPKSDMIEIPVVVAPRIARDIPKGSRIVIADITGSCALELKNALMKRLVDNSDYQVLTRDNLRQLIQESEAGWTGKFNTQTATRLGELLGASLFIVGNVAYCGKTLVPAEDGETTQYDILAVLQILDLQTGRVLMSSADQGTFKPRTTQLLVPANPLVDVDPDPDPDSDYNKERLIQVNYPIFKAAQDLANDFADKFFSRPTWESLEMWRNIFWHYGDSIRYIKLGHCDRAVGLLESIGAQELHTMPERYVAEYLHNYGVALLCDNQIAIAMDKLRSAYRLTYDPITLQMLDLAAKLEEWSLEVQIDKEPEIKLLMKREDRIGHQRNTRRR